VQLTRVASQEWEPTPVVSTTEFIDWRRETDPKSEIENLKSKIVWAEGATLPNISSLSRHQLQLAEALVIWTAPPGHDIFQQALATVQPQQVFLVGQPSPFDTLSAFIKQLMGLIKHALSHKAGEVELEALAASLGHRVTTVRLGLDWLLAQGKLSIYAEENGLLVLRPAQQPSTDRVTTVEEMLQSALAETAAYRGFFRNTSLKVLEKGIGARER
jgi:hypothetical protein